MQNIILNLIKQNGFITIDDFIFQAMCNNNYGYYTQNNPLMKDFVTSPEITNAFGIVIASKIIDKLTTLNLNEIQEIHFCEFGGGTGKLAFDILNFVLELNKINNGKINNLIKKINYISIEYSEKLMEIQKNKLNNLNVDKYFFKNINDYFNKCENNKNNLTVFISNEFFDALPIKQFILNKNELMEIVVINKNNKLIYSKIPVNKNELLNNYFNIQNILENSILELPIIGINILEDVINFMNKNKSMFVTFDYGFFQGNHQNTLQGIYKGEKQENILENVGEADITHLVNFELFANVFKKNKLIPELKTQKEFLIENGILHLINEENNNGIARILDESQMGNLFKVLWAENL